MILKNLSIVRSRSKFPLFVLVTMAILLLTATATLATPAAGSDKLSADLNIFQAIFLGLVQGVTEFLPISSSAHLKVVPEALHWGDPGVAFTAIIQLGSIAAVIWFFWSDIVTVVTGAFTAIGQKDYRSLEFQMAVGIVLGTIPIVFFGLLIKIYIKDFDHSPLRSLGALACASIFMSILLGISERIGRRDRDLHKLRIIDGMWMGLGQCLALIPGCSRSGATLTAGLFLGLERAAAARFSFLLGIPSITLAGVSELKSALETGFSGVSVVSLIVGTLSAAVFSYLSIAWLLKFLQTNNTFIFICYRLAFGTAILTAVAFGRLIN
nr:undecaprenyl-diphosphate phosphatase [Chamaesiphon sp. OTE_20_metabat_361]